MSSFHQYPEQIILHLLSSEKQWYFDCHFDYFSIQKDDITIRFWFLHHHQMSYWCSTLFIVGWKLVASVTVYCRSSYTCLFRNGQRIAPVSLYSRANVRGFESSSWEAGKFSINTILINCMNFRRLLYCSIYHRDQKRCNDLAWNSRC